MVEVIDDGIVGGYVGGTHGELGARGVAHRILLCFMCLHSETHNMFV